MKYMLLIYENPENAMITIARKGSVRNSFVLHGNSFETNGPGRLPDLAALIPGPPEPGVELVLNGALNDQPRPEPRQLRQRLARVIADPHSQQPLNLILDLADGGTVRLTA
jgi:hypothetical protein